MHLRWTGEDASGPGFRDEFGLDNVEMTYEVPQPTINDISDLGQHSSDVTGPQVPAGLDHTSLTTLKGSATREAGDSTGEVIDISDVGVQDHCHAERR